MCIQNEKENSHDQMKQNIRREKRRKKFIGPYRISSITQAIQSFNNEQSSEYEIQNNQEKMECLGYNEGDIEDFKELLKVGYSLLQIILIKLVYLL